MLYGTVHKHTVYRSSSQVFNLSHSPAEDSAVIYRSRIRVKYTVLVHTKKE